MYKFIFETNHDKLIQIQTIFGESAQFIKRESANGKYTSLTIKEMMLDADSIFARYEQMAAVPGIISL
jgi:putative lipoic acid-binding regulatory protein